jgi:pantetheine-phosphate adenylyltransferase
MRRYDRMRTAAFPGSFDPFSIEHLYITEMAAQDYDLVYVIIADNKAKDRMFLTKERVTIAKHSCAKLDNVVVTSTDRIVVDFVKELGVNTLIRGLRDTKDFEYERGIASWNRLIGDIKTVGIFGRNDIISSTAIRELINFEDGRWKPFVNPEAVPYIEELLSMSIFERSGHLKCSWNAKQVKPDHENICKTVG